ncbi:MAG: response regulator transcription factor [Acidimicrobiia bacterium]|nr:response regulator transcription factor [Acidimicrobiia bacterium]MDH3398493.1 response regulator transcription factor [Acidimicrobiia bacterium]
MSAKTHPAGRVLVVDDEPMVREVVTRYLERDGFRVDATGDGLTALDLARARPPDLLILDVMLPSKDGFSVLAELRKTSSVPVILLTARADETDRVLGLELGADDYVVKPFSPRELAARVRSVLRRSNPTEPGTRLDFEGLTIDPQAREVKVGEKTVDLTPKEFDVLTFLASHPRQVFSRGQLLQQVWDSSAEWQDPATVTVHMRRLRTKLEADPQDPRWLLTVWGVGYRFEP